MIYTGWKLNIPNKQGQRTSLSDYVLAARFFFGNTAQWELRLSADLLPHYAVLPFLSVRFMGLFYLYNNAIQRKEMTPSGILQHKKH